MNQKEIEKRLTEYEKQGFDDWQMYEIRKGLEEGVDVTKYADPKLTDEEMAEIRKGFNVGDVEKNQTLEVKEENINKNININSNSFSIGQQRQIEWGLENKVDVSKYADPKFNSYQMEEIRWKLEKQKEPEIEI